MARTGFFPAGTLSGSPWEASVERLPHGVGNLAMAFGDVVSLEDDGNANVAAAGETNVLGSCVGIEVPNKPGNGVGNMGTGALNLEVGGKYTPTGSNVWVLVCTAPDAIYEASVGNGTLTEASRGKNVDIIAGTNNLAGQSGHILDAGSNTAGTAQFRLIDYKRDIGNGPTDTNAVWYVTPNEHMYKKTTGV